MSSAFPVGRPVARRGRQRFRSSGSVGEYIVALVLAVVLLGGLALLGAAYWQIGRHVQALGWYSVPAQVLEIGEDAAPGNGRSLANSTRRIVGKLAYSVNGQSYVTERLSFTFTRDRSLDDWWPAIQRALRVADGRVSVWVNPADPTDAVFERGVRWIEIAIFFGFGALATFAGYQLLFGAGIAEPAGGFSWRVVAGTAVVGAFCAVLTPLLWRDGHSVWAVIATLPALLALVGAVNGLRGAASSER